MKIDEFQKNVNEKPNRLRKSKQELDISKHIGCVQDSQWRLCTIYVNDWLNNGNTRSNPRNSNKKKKMTQPQVSEHDKAEVTQDTCSLLQIASHHVWAKSDCKSV